MKYSFEFSMSVETQTGEPLAAYFRVRRGRVARTREFKDGVLFADYNSKWELLGVELLGPCKVCDLEKTAIEEPEAQNFMRRSAPRDMVPA